MDNKTISKIEKLKELMSLISNDTVTPSELKGFLELVLSVIKKSKDEFDNLSKENIDLIKKSIEYVKNESSQTISKLDTKAETSKKELDTLLKEAKAFLVEVKNIKAEKGQDGLDGKDADEEVIVDKVLSKIKLPEQKEVILDGGIEIVNKINDLPLDEDKKIDAKHVKGLPEVQQYVARGGGNTEVFKDGVKVGSGQGLNFTGDSVSVTHNGSRATINISNDTTATWGSIGGTIDNQTDINDNFLKLDQTTPQTTVGTFNLEGLNIEDESNQLLKLRRTDTFDFVQYRRLASGVWTDITNEAGISRGSVSGDVLDVLGDTFVIGKVNKFSSIYIDIGTARSATGIFIWEYSLGGDTWAELTVTDGTNFLLNDGVISFEQPIDWATDTQNSSDQLYFVRLRFVSSTISVEPTVYLVVPNDGKPSLEVYANGRDTVPTLSVNGNGQVLMGYTPTSSTPGTATLAVSGSSRLTGEVTMSGALSGVTSLATSGVSTNTLSTTGFNHVGGLILNGPVATAIIPNQNSPIVRFSAQSWNGTATRVNAMDIYVNPDSEPVTNARMAFKNRTIDGITESSELMNLDSNGRLNVIGRAQANEDMFDRVFSFVGTTWTDITLAVSSFGTITGDVLNVVNDFVYIGKEEKFNEMYFDFGTIISGSTARLWQYWNGTEWATLTVTDGTNNWANDGSATFTPPVDWATSTVNAVTDLYWVRVGTVSGTFTTEPTLRALLPNTTAITKEVLSNNWFDGTTGWTTTGDLAYTTNDYTFTYSTGLGTLRQAKEDFNSPLEPSTWYRFRYTLGVAGATNTVAWIGPEVATGKTYFQATSTTEIDAFFKTNSNPGDFVIYVKGTASGFRIDNVFLKKIENGIIYASGDIRSDGVFRGNGTDGIKIDSSGNVGIGTTSPTAVLHLKAGTATSGTAPLKLTSGVVNTTPEAGAVEYDGTNLHFTPTGILRENIHFGSKGSATLTAGTTTTITTSGAKTTSVILIQPTSSAITLLGAYISAKNAGSFVITHGVAAGTESFDWVIIN